MRANGIITDFWRYKLTVQCRKFRANAADQAYMQALPAFYLDYLAEKVNHSPDVRISI
jgi:hypothetical protein